MRINITLKIDSEIYNKFSRLCDEKGLIRSRIVENLIKEFLQ